MNIISRNAFLLGAALSTGWACASANAPVDIGDGRKGERLEDYAAHWEGYAEAYNFADGSDKVKLTLDASGNGTLQIGDSAPLPVATDPSVAYPASFTGTGALDEYTKLFPGFAYAIDTATVESARIRFTLNPWQVAHDWCSLQTAYDTQAVAGGSGGAGGAGGVNRGGAGGDGAVPPGYLVGPDSGGYGLGRYRCLPNFERSISDVCSYSVNGTPASVDCEKAELCLSGVCSCDTQGCDYYQPPSGAYATRAKLDAALDEAGNSLVGTLKISNAAQVAVTVRLHRVSNN